MNNNDKKEIINLIDNLNAISFYELNEHSKECYYEIRNAILAMSTDASQEPCEDAISRQVALEIIKNLYPDIPVIDYMGARQKWRKKYAPYIECENAIEQLPPVTPKQRTGKWITQWNVAHQKEYYYCSECREEFSYDGETGIAMNDYKYCPNCGCHMV